MTINSRIRERGIDGMLIIALFLGAGIYSCVAQVPEETAGALHVNQMKNADKKINLVANLNLNAKATPLNASINSPYEELKPAVAPGGSRLYFSRALYPGNTGGSNDLEDIWYTEFDSTATIWSEPMRLPGKLNNAGPNFINGISVTGDTIVLGNQYLKKGKMRDGFSYSVDIEGQWSDPMPILVKNDYNMSEHASAHVSFKAGVIISAIQRADSYGSRDLYVSFWNGDEASEPINMGSIINSTLEESSPYLACDNQTLYFASKGHHGFGGYDIYMSKRLDESWTNWSVPKNMGPAINGALDDEFFIITHCKRFAFFSKQVSVHNIDLFRIPISELYNQPGSEAKVADSNKPASTEPTNVNNKNKNGALSSLMIL